jgi:predicted amidohydrolase
MRGSLLLAAAQPYCEARNVSANAHAHAQAVREAHARVVIFPELSLTGYELDARPVDVNDAALQPIVEACADCDAIAFVGAPVEEHGQRFIATLRIDKTGATVAYRKSHLGGDEHSRFAPGDGPTVVEIDGWRLGMGICKDTGVADHTAGTAELGVDVFVAGLVHLPNELEEQDARGRRIAAACGAYVAFASFAGATGGGYNATAGESTIWSPDGRVLARATAAPGDTAVADLTDRPSLTSA